MSFYRTYRPQVIAEIDNEQVRASLTTLLSKDKADLPHAYLFSGPRGAGKTTAARVVAKMYNCVKPTKIGPCGSCQQCISISQGTNLDVLEMDAASNRGIDEIRQLRMGVHLAPAAAAFKVFIIDEVHMLTTEAFNALLKTLEEPPKHAVFVLATTDPQKIPATIRSRCVEIVFTRAKVDELLQAMGRIAKSEKIDIDKEALTAIAGSVDGSFRDAVKLLEQVSFHKGKITQETVVGLLSLSGSQEVASFIGSIVNKDVKGALAAIEQLVNNGADIRAFLTECLKNLQARLILIAKGDYDASAQNRFFLRKVAAAFTTAYAETKFSPIAQLPLELAVIDLCTHEDEQPAQIPMKNTQMPTPVKQSFSSSATMPQTDSPKEEPAHVPLGLLTLEKLNEHWKDFINELKPHNHSIAGVLRSSRPKTVAGGIVVIEAFYKFHQERLADNKTREILSQVLKKLFGEKVQVQVELGKK